MDWKRGGNNRPGYSAHGETTDPGTVDNRPGYWVQWTTDLGTVDVGYNRPGYSGRGGHKTWVQWTWGDNRPGYCGHGGTQVLGTVDKGDHGWTPVKHPVKETSF